MNCELWPGEYRPHAMNRCAEVVLSVGIELFQTHESCFTTRPNFDFEWQPVYVKAPSSVIAMSGMAKIE